MNYVDFDMLTGPSPAVYDNSYYILDLILNYAELVKEADYYLEPTLYIILSRNIITLKSELVSVGRDSENRPFISYCGIHFYMLSTDEAAKYQLLK